MVKKALAIALSSATILGSSLFVAAAPSIRGDVDGDGKITATDYLRIKNMLLGVSTFSASFPEEADVNGDGVVNTTDYLTIKCMWLNQTQSKDEAAKKLGTFYIPDFENYSTTAVKTYYNGTVDSAISKLVEKGVLDSDVKVNSFTIDGTKGTFDFSAEFGAQVNNARGSEGLLVGAVANTMIKNFGITEFSFTVEGETLETGLSIYDFSIGFSDFAKVYLPNEDKTSLITVNARFDGTADALVNFLVEQKVLAEGVKLNSFEIVDDTISIDLSCEFGEQLSNARSAESFVYLPLTNTLLDYFDAKHVIFTVEGEVLETGLTIYDFPIEFASFESNDESNDQSNDESNDESNDQSADESTEQPAE